MRVLIGPRLGHPDDVGVLGIATDDVQQAFRDVVEALRRLEQHLRERVSLARVVP